MREQASLIQKEVGVLLNDVRLLSDRVGKLQNHFGQAEGDIKDILVSAGKVVGRAERIERVDLATDGRNAAAHALERAAGLEGGGERAFVEIIELAADRHAMREPRHLHCKGSSASIR